VKPFLRATNRARLAPVGWVAEPAGVWAGRQVEVVFDPRQHQIVMVRNEPGETTRAALAGEGFRRLRCRRAPRRCGCAIARPALSRNASPCGDSIQAARRWRYTEGRGL
jgi:hypothetical protein